MFIQQLFVCLLIVGYAHCVYVSNIEVNIGTTKKIVRLELGERDYNNGTTLPSKFFLINDAEEIVFYRRVLNEFGSYEIDLSGRGGLNTYYGEFVSFTRKSLIIVHIDFINGFTMKGEIELDNYVKMTLNASPMKPKQVQQKRINGVKRLVKRQVPASDFYGKTCALGKTYSFCDQCGKSYVQPNVKRIVGGQTVAQTSWPSAGILMGRAEFFRNIYNIRCSLTLIERTTAVTAAQCYIKAFGIKSYTVVFGLHKMALASYLKITSIKGFFTHPNYNSKTLLNDIAVIKLTREIIYDNYTQPACLPLPSFQEPTSDQRAWIVGYGTTSFGGNYTEYLQNAAVTYYASSSNKCKKHIFPIDSSTQICAGNYENGGVDSCNGDTGGPLYTKDEVLNTYVLTGVTSSGFGCGKPEYPGIYTKIKPHLYWITQMTQIVLSK